MYKCLIILLLTISFQTKSIPTIHVKYATIIVEQGNEIYANGRMQSVLRVDYMLKQGVEFVGLALKEYETGRLLDEIGWTISDTDNGYDHNIYGNFSRNYNNIKDKHKLDRKLQNFDKKSAPEVNQFIYKYISTELPNEYIKICLELTTEKSSEQQVYSTCYDPGIYRGYVILYADRPIKYYDSDFMFSDKKPMFKVVDGKFSEYSKYEIAGYVFSLSPKSYISRSRRFKVLMEGKILTEMTFQSGQSKEVAYQYKNIEPPSETPKPKENDYIGYTGFYFYKMLSSTGQPLDIMYFEFYSFDYTGTQPRSRGVQAFTTNEVVNILQVDYYKNTFLKEFLSPPGDSRCKKLPSVTEDSYYECYKLDGERHIFPKIIGQDLVDKRFVEIPIEDNFGNRHTISWIVYVPQ